MISKTKKCIYKVIAFAVIICFTANNAWALPGMGIEVAIPRETPNFLQIEIPSDIASIEEVYEAPAQADPKLILHVQNIHGNYESQVKIKKLLEYLYTKYGFKLIFAEGAVDKLDPELLRLYPDAERNIKLADSMTKSGELTGIEYFLMEGPRDVEAIGIEETQLYRKDYEAFRKVYAVKDESDAYLEMFESKLETLASRIFSSNTRRLLSEWRKFEEGRRDFLPYVKRLTIDAKSVLGLDLESLFAQVEWPQISRLLALQAMEKDLDEKAADKEKERLLKFLEENQIAPEIGGAIQKLHERKITVTRTDDAEKRLEDLPRYLFERLAREAGPKGFRFHDYPAFSLWAGHLILQNELDSKLLFEEIEKVFTKVLDEMTVSEREKNLMELYRDEVLLKKLLHLELTRKEWERVSYRKDWIDLRPMVGRLKKLSEEFGSETSESWERLGEGSENAHVEAVRKAVSTGYEFYDYARQRENVFYETISSEMGRKNIDKAVVVTGGFHTEGLMDIFREKEINCSILMPRIAGDLSTSEYISTMMENKSVMFELATIEAVARMSLLVTQMQQRSASMNQKDVAYEISRILFHYIANFGPVNSLEELKRNLEFFNQSPFAGQNNAALQFELASNGTQNIWIRYKGTLVSSDGQVVEIPFKIEGEKVVLRDHTETGPPIDTLPADFVAQPEAAGAPRSEIRMIRRDFFKNTLMMLALLAGGSLPTQLQAQPTGKPAIVKEENVKLVAIRKIAKEFNLNAKNKFIVPFQDIDAADETVYGKNDNAVRAHFAWRSYLMKAADALAAEGFESDQKITQSELGLLVSLLEEKKAINYPNPYSIRIQDDKYKRDNASFYYDQRGRKVAVPPSKRAENIKKLEAGGNFNFQSLLQPTTEHDELISQTARAVLKLWLAPAALREALFKNIPKELIPEVEKEKFGAQRIFLTKSVLFSKGAPVNEADKPAYAKFLYGVAITIVGINEVASTGPKAGIYDPKKYYAGKERVLYRFTPEDALSLVNHWSATDNEINFGKIIQHLVALKIGYEQAERVTKNILTQAFKSNRKPQEALLSLLPAKEGASDMDRIVLELIKNTEIEALLQKLPADDKEAGDKRKFYEAIKAASDFKAFETVLKDNGISADMLSFKLEVTHRKAPKKTAFESFFDLIKAAKDVAEVRKIISEHRFALISKGEIARLSNVQEASAGTLATLFSDNLGKVLYFNMKDQRIETEKQEVTAGADNYRNALGNNDSSYAANFLIMNGNLIGNRDVLLGIYTDLFGPHRLHAFDTLLVINPTAFEGINVFSNTSDTLAAVLPGALSRAIGQPGNYTGNVDPSVQVRLKKLQEILRGRSEIRKPETSLISIVGNSVRVEIGEGGDGVLIDSKTLHTAIGNFDGTRLAAYVARAEKGVTLAKILEALNTKEINAEVEAKIDESEREAVRANLEKFAGVLSRILAKEKKQEKPKAAKAAKVRVAPAKEQPEVVTEEEMAQSLRVGSDTLQHYLNQTAEELNLSAEETVALIAGGIFQDPLISRVREINRRLKGEAQQANNTADAPSLQKLAVTQDSASVIAVVKMSQFSQSDLLDPENGLLASVELLLRANPKASISIVLVDDAASITDQLLSNINLNVNNLQAALGKETRLRVVRSSSDDKTLTRTLEMVRRQMMMTRIKTTGIRMTQMRFTEQGYTELFANDKAGSDFGLWIRNMANPMADADKIFGARLKKDPMMDLLAGMLFALLKSSETTTNGAEIAAKAEALKYQLDAVKKEFGYQDITEALSDIVAQLMAQIRSEMRTSQSA